ncbi:DUF4279 domain-containing protein [Aeromicrobium wangtongii]|uniref:DUF4279 domain-containing protein n=1 Tax=Aeromicrobium wangtongii TaxID=2969247 RepID=A0ABY5MBY0_9ACTN|nr:DUF4279 domain-containing protein [Aeromicrobium wangtongii]MCD9196923.1 DUF4279 domain-containing protein [Aeromicrobium wangtongii]UUP14429.1 DUF4279 domain-containing protein [Aeromicrobium wangtongii]
MSQYACFALRSQSMSSVEMAAHLAVEPDEVTVRGSRQLDPVRPAGHSWKVVCRTPGLDLDTLVATVLDRVAPAAARIRELVDADVIDATLLIVRYFNDEAGQAEEKVAFDEDGHTWEKMPGQHHMLGWSLEAETLELLVSMGASIDVDEYGWPMSMS